MKHRSRSGIYGGKTEPLWKLCLSITDCHHSTPKWTDSGYLVVRNFNIQRGTIVLDEPSYTDAETFRERIGRAKPEQGDLIISREAPMGVVGMIPNGVECCLGQRMVLIKPDPKKVDARYLLFALQSEFVQKQIGASDKTGSIVSNLRIPVLKELAIPVFDKDIEADVARVIGCLDSKIALNTRINAELEALAKLVYDYWFVQFDFPISAAQAKRMGQPKLAGKPYKSSGGPMVYNQELKREVPEGWEAQSLSSLVKVSKEALNPQDELAKEFKHYSIPAYDLCEGYALEKGSDIMSSKFIVREQDLLVSKLNPWFNRVVYAQDEEDAIASSEFVVWRTADQNLKSFLYRVARSAGFIAHCTKSASGTSNSHKRVNPDVMMCFRIPYDADVATEYGRLTTSYLQLLATNRKQNQELTALRDWLLPLLMNGQVVVSAPLDVTPAPRTAENGVAMAAEPDGRYGKQKANPR